MRFHPVSRFFASPSTDTTLRLFLLAAVSGRPFTEAVRRIQCHIPPALLARCTRPAVLTMKASGGSIAAHKVSGSRYYDGRSTHGHFNHRPASCLWQPCSLRPSLRVWSRERATTRCPDKSCDPLPCTRRQTLRVGRVREVYAWRLREVLTFS